MTRFREHFNSIQKQRYNEGLGDAIGILFNTKGNQTKELLLKWKTKNKSLLALMDTYDNYSKKSQRDLVVKLAKKIRTIYGRMIVASLDVDINKIGLDRDDAQRVFDTLGVSYAYKAVSDPNTTDRLDKLTEVFDLLLKKKNDKAFMAAYPQYFKKKKGSEDSDESEGENHAEPDSRVFSPEK